jgi:hypothetical protein
MSQSSPLTPAPLVGETMVYRPLSALALASVLLAILYVVLLAVTAVVALLQAGPVFLPTWSLLVPVAAVALGLAAQWRIRSAEGTLAGVSLARWGLWLGLLAGLGYGTYYFVTGWAIQQQANDFLMKVGEDSGFFPHLLKAGKSNDPGELNRAFLLATPYGRRVGSNPDDLRKMEIEYNQPKGKQGRGELDIFRGQELVELTLEAGREGKTVEPLGVQEWSYENGRYHVARVYRVSTREMQVDILVPVAAEVDKLAGGRKWYIEGNKVQMVTSPQLTPLGEAMRRLRESAALEAKKWTEGAQPQSARVPQDETPWKEPKGLLVIADEGHSEDQIRQQAQTDVTAVLRGKVAGPYRPSLVKSLLCPWREEDGHIRLWLPFTLPLHVPGGVQYGFVGEGTLTLQSRDRLDPLHLTGTSPWDVIALRLERIRPHPHAAQMMQMIKASGGPSEP